MTICEQHVGLESKIDKIIIKLGEIDTKISDKSIESERRFEDKFDRGQMIRESCVKDNEKSHDDLWEFIRKMDKRAAVYIAATAGIGGLLGFMFKYGVL